jgi:quercetin 2,3-dioxygenase
MITLRRAAERGHANHGWLDSWHSFSFADYHDPAHMGVGNLRVINEDRVAPGHGFGTHGHRDMEIVSYVLEGELAHQDSMGNGVAGSVAGAAAGGAPGAASGIIRPGDVQRMSAGTGVRHSEFNRSSHLPVHFLQIWILPSRAGIQPGYEQKHFAPAERRGVLRPIVSPTGADGALSLHADASIHAGYFDGEEQAQRPLDPKRLCYVHLARGALEVNGVLLGAGDAALLDGEALLDLRAGRDAEVLVFDLARGAG